MRLFYDEYIFYLVEQRIANMNTKLRLHQQQQQTQQMQHTLSGLIVNGTPW